MDAQHAEPADKPVQGTSEHHVRLLAGALTGCLEAAGIVRQGAELTGPELLLFASDLKEQLLAGRDEAGKHGWVCYNGGPGAIFWSPERASLEHELSDDIRPATAYEKHLFGRFGQETADGYMIEPEPVSLPGVPA